MSGEKEICVCGNQPTLETHGELKEIIDLSKNEKHKVLDYYTALAIS
ncbi:hypothetical protein BSPWISOXPB_9327 [uncultured Gammaproteobacteria bacterium]|nr:hypothetical protein BSPWISOXPB_9327 [uncultured Gammaproteobacteria bacterium]